MQPRHRHALIVCCAPVATAVARGITTLTLASDYDFRGVSQTDRAPTAQLNAELNFARRWKAGLFVSNVYFGRSPQFGNPHLELAPYVQADTRVSANLSLGAGANYYSYMLDGGGSYDFAELFVAAAYRSIKAAFYCTPDYSGQAAGGLSGMYAAVDGTTFLRHHWSLLEHAGYSWGEYWAGPGNGNAIDYSLGLGYKLRNFDVTLVYINTSPTAGSGRAVLSLVESLPW